MNEKLLEIAKEKAFDIHVYEGEYSHHETEYTFVESEIIALLELVQANAVTNDEKTHDLHSNGQQIFGLKPLFDSSGTAAKLVTAIQLLQELDDEWSSRNWGYNINIRPKIQAFLKQDKS